VVAVRLFLDATVTATDTAALAMPRPDVARAGKCSSGRWRTRRWRLARRSTRFFAGAWHWRRRRFDEAPANSSIVDAGETVDVGADERIRSGEEHVETVAAGVEEAGATLGDATRNQADAAGAVFVDVLEAVHVLGGKGIVRFEEDLAAVENDPRCVARPGREALEFLPLDQPGVGHRFGAAGVTGNTAQPFGFGVVEEELLAGRFTDTTEPGFSWSVVKAGQELEGREQQILPGRAPSRFQTSNFRFPPVVPVLSAEI